MKTRSPHKFIGLLFIALSVYVLAYLTVTESFLGTLFPTGITAIIIGAMGVKLYKIGIKQKKKEEKEFEAVQSKKASTTNRGA